MFANNLFERILIKPVEEQEANLIYIVSGYATATMATKHIEELIKLKGDSHNMKINLIVGMCPYDGLLKRNHEQFIAVVTKTRNVIFECNYLIKPAPVHSKMYVWFKDNLPVSCHLGSANYTQNAFSKNQRELMIDADPQIGRDYYMELYDETASCLREDLEEYITFHDRIYRVTKKGKIKQRIKTEKEETEKEIDYPKVTVSLLGRDGELPQRSGLNWGQRPEENREPNQAYIRLTADIYRTNFFPPVGTHFTIITDDDKELICSRAQQNGKAIHSPLNNSLIGEYFRSRLGLANGVAVTKQDLINYGRNDIDFYKIDEETFLMDFSV